MEKKINIVIPAYNCKNTLYKTLASIATQTFTSNIKVSIINDASPEGSYQDIIDFFIPELDIEEIILSENGGPAIARQYGINHTTSPYIMFIDADDMLINPYSIEAMVNFIEKEEGVAIYGQVLAEEEEGGVIRAFAKNTFIHGKIYKVDFLRKHHIHFGNKKLGEDMFFQHLVNFYVEQYNYVALEFSEDVVLYTYNPQGLSRSIQDDEFIPKKMMAYAEILKDLVLFLQQDKEIDSTNFIGYCLVEFYLEYNYMASIHQEDKVFPLLKSFMEIISIENIDYNTCNQIYQDVVENVGHRLLQDGHLSTITLPIMGFREFIALIKGE